MSIWSKLIKRNSKGLDKDGKDEGILPFPNKHFFEKKDGNLRFAVSLSLRVNHGGGWIHIPYLPDKKLSLFEKLNFSIIILSHDRRIFNE